MKKNDTEQIRIANRKLIINYVRINGPVARVDIGRALNLSPATITQITAELQKDGRILEISSEQESGAARGRPRILIDLAPDASSVLVVKLAINELRILLGDHKGNVVTEAVYPLQTRELNAEQLTGTLLTAITGFIKKLARRRRPKAVCVVVQGAVNGVTGEILWSPVLKERNIPLRQVIEEQIKLPTTVINDANCLAIGIRQLPAYQDLNDLVVVMLGHGLGMGCFINGVLYQGPSGGAGELGHLNYMPNGAQCLCGKRGCVEAYLGDYALFRDARMLLPFAAEDELHPTEQSMQALVDLAEAGNGELVDMFHRAGVALGYALAGVIGILRPAKIIISGPGVRSYKYLEPGVDAGLTSALVPVLSAGTEIESVALGGDQLIFGAISLALQALD
ncbi:ROK family protein [Zhongshania sp.]|uniref:ROK family protein n=1 Tax=Zhongshania sp. TaxID=1971902 RepID=UPI00356737EE